MADGEIDFIVASRRTADPVQPWRFEHRMIDIDTPWETAIKKMFYRPSTFKLRDAFDLAAVIDHHGAQLQEHLSVVADKLDKLLDRLDALTATYESAVIDDVNSTAASVRYAKSDAIKSAIAFLTDWRERQA